MPLTPGSSQQVDASLEDQINMRFPDALSGSRKALSN